MNHFASQLRRWQKATQAEAEKPAPEPKFTPPEKAPPPYRPNGKEIVAGGDIRWKPVNKEAAKLLMRAHWLCLPQQEPKYATKVPNTEHEPRSSRDAKSNKPMPGKPRPNRKQKKSMKGALTENITQTIGPGYQNPQSYTTDSGVRVKIVNGVEMICIDDIQALLAREIANLPKETRPAVKAAEDARAVINEIMHGLGGDMEKFRENSKRYLEDIRGNRMAMVTETSQMVGALKEVRQFFLGGDYKQEIARLQEFVDLCERLNKLKDSGFLDQVADTMLKLGD